MSHGKQFTLYSCVTGPDGWKVAFVLEELGLTYETVWLRFDKQEQKAPEFTKYNPNGRIPAIIDHYNNDFVLWESVAIILYLTDKYDLEHKISVSDSDEKYQQLQWLLFQASGQGPYFAQGFWFQFYHKEKVPSAVERYDNETRRVLGVLDGVLSKREYLIGGKLTIADLAFIPWNASAIKSTLGTDFDFDKEFPAAAKWHKKLLEREPVKKLFALRASFPN